METFLETLQMLLSTPEIAVCLGLMAMGTIVMIAAMIPAPIVDTATHERLRRIRR